MEPKNDSLNHETSPANYLGNVSGLTVSVRPTAPNSIISQRHEVVKIIGVGGQGGNTVQYLYDAFSGLENSPLTFLAVNTDFDDLDKIPMPNKFTIGKDCGRGHGAGGDAEKGEKAMIESREEFKALIQSEAERSENPLELVLLLAGMGGGTGSGATVEIARILRELHVACIPILTIPDFLDGDSRVNTALSAVEKIQELVPAIVFYDNNGLTEHFGALSRTEAYRRMDDAIQQTTESFINVILRVVRQNQDLNDIKSTLGFFDENTDRRAGIVIIGTAMGPSEDFPVESRPEGYDKLSRVEKTFVEAINAPLLMRHGIQSARCVLYQLLYNEKSAVTQDEIGRFKRMLRRETGSGAVLDIKEGGGPVDDVPEGKCRLTVMLSLFSDEKSPLDLLREQYDDWKEREKRREEEESKGSLSQVKREPQPAARPIPNVTPIYVPQPVLTVPTSVTNPGERRVMRSAAAAAPREEHVATPGETLIFEECKPSSEAQGEPIPEHTDSHLAEEFENSEIYARYQRKKQGKHK